MSVPEPMLSSPAQAWPAGGSWVLQPKWDGFRCLIEIDRRPRAWSRHGTSLTANVGDLLSDASVLPRGSVLDGELIALAERDNRPVQDFATVQRAIFAGDAGAIHRLRFIAFDLLSLAGRDLRVLPWRERDQVLRHAVQPSRLIRVIDSQPASQAAHAGMLNLGFEGSVLKRQTSIYRPGRQSSWRKLKARHSARVTLLALKQGRDGQTFAICDRDGQRMIAGAAAEAERLVGHDVDVIYSRVDADGALREARLKQRSWRAADSPR